MPSQAYEMVRDSLEPVVGDILAIGIIKTGLKKVGADPESATRDNLRGAIDAHILESIRAFMGKDKATLWAAQMKERLGHMGE